MQALVEPLSGSPSPPTSFVGRREELEQLRRLLSTTRHVTIVGAGGSGKTRLAEELARQVARSFGDGLAVAYLAGATTEADVGHIVAGAVGLRDRGGRVEALVDYLRPRRYLLVLDNCEHLNDAVAVLATRLVAACPRLTVVATSRRLLRVPGEQAFPVEGLTPEAALTLFSQRVRLVHPSFVLPDDERGLVVDLCARLDRMPLAVELAAAGLRHLGLDELVRRVVRHLPDLGSSDPAMPARQRTLRETIDWSHGLLSGEQQALWRRLSIFAGAFDLDAAEAVGSIAPLQRDEISTILGELVDRSMVAFDLASGRYRIIEAMRAYGRERLVDADEIAETTARHRAWIVAEAEDLDRRWWGPDQASGLDRLAAAGADLRVALEACRMDGEDVAGMRIATASLWYWVTRASLGEAAEWFAAFQAAPADPSLRARASWRAGYVAVLRGRVEDARRLLADAERLADEANEPGVRAYARIITCLRVMYEVGGDAAMPLLHDALDDPAADDMTRCWGHIGVSLISFLQGDWQDCQAASLAGLEMCQAVGERWSREILLRSLAYAEWRLGDLAAAEQALLDALRIDRQLDDLWHLAWTTEVLAWVTADQGRWERAARLLGIAASFWARTGSGPPGAWRTLHDAAEAQLRRRSGDERFERALDAGRALDQARALSEALDEGRPARPAQGPGPRISQRELEVARLVAEGYANRVIAERLFLSPRTVETHVQHLMDKLGVGSRAQIAAWHATAMSDPAGTATDA
jgi:non-specific serine/threonine protein kinase